MKPLVETRLVTCAAPRELLWSALADTDQLNRFLGLSAPQVSRGGDGAARFTMGTPRSRYLEEPYQWCQGSDFGVRRLFVGGLLREYSLSFGFADRPAGTEVSVRLAITARYVLAWPIARFVLGRFTARLATAVRDIDANLGRGLMAFAGTPCTPHDPSGLARARGELEGALAAADRELGERLCDHVASAADAELVRIRPYDLAESWQVAPRRLLDLCLHAVISGLLDLTWEVICPSCRTATETASTLADLEDEAHCQLCDLSIKVDLERAVEATFRPAEKVRSLASGPYCIGGPSRTPHVVAQSILPAGGSVILPAPSAPGRYRIFVRGGASCSVEVEAGGRERVAVQVGDEVEPAQISVAPGAELTVIDGARLERHVKIEHLEWATRAATAHDVASDATFRRLFSAEVLRPGLSLKVGRVALLFTDLAGSTALYAELGDARAYAVVQAHFEALGRAIDAAGGAVVKTIGDAVMASFVDEADAVRATVAMQRAYGDLAARDPGAARMQLRVGGFAGPCYLVNANDLLDYFGQSVNIAGRIQSLAGGGDIVLPADLATRGLAEGWLDGVHEVERFDADLKGVATPIAVTRLRLGKAKAGAAAVADSARTRAAVADPAETRAAVADSAKTRAAVADSAETRAAVADSAETRAAVADSAETSAADPGAS